MLFGTRQLHNKYLLNGYNNLSAVTQNEMLIGEISERGKKVRGKVRSVCILSVCPLDMAIKNARIVQSL